MFVRLREKKYDKVNKWQSLKNKYRTVNQYNSVAKLFDHLETLYSVKPFKSIVMISERGMCDSCKGVMQQFMSRHPEVVVKAISNKKVVGDVWKNRRKRKNRI